MASQLAENHFKYFKFILSVFERSIDNVVALIGDNTNKNYTFSRLIEPAFVSCHSHWFNLAVKDVIKDNKGIIAKGYVQMSKILYFIPAAMIRCNLPLRVKLSNDTQ